MTSLGGNLKISPDTSSNLLYSTTESAMSEMPVASVDVKKRYENIKKSPNDKRLYRGLILNNDMKVLLISDPTTDKSAASLDINVGYFSDPGDLPGLAHFCEHMLFLGTEKYPERNEYNSFLSQNGGGSNASTSTDHTNYYFDVKAEGLEGALDRFAQFFLNPLFTESATELEVNAVDSEHDKNIPNDAWRFDQLDRSSADKSHPYSKFGTGNKGTLDIMPKERGINVREALLKFHEEWYSANLMALSVLGKESLDDLEKMVISKFSEVKNKGISAPEWPEHPFNYLHYQHKWYVVPVKDIRTLKITFPMPDLREHFRSGPASYVSHLIGHEADGSLLSALKKLGWSNSLIAGITMSGRGGCNFFNIAVDLTEEGINHTDDIVTLTFQYINMLRQAGPLEWIFDEYKQIAQMEFNFKEKSLPRSCVTKTSHALQKYPMEEILSGLYLPTEWRPDLINNVMDHLLPQNVRIYVGGKVFEDIANETETWYGTRYHKEKIPEEIINKWSDPGLHDELKYPTKNEFIPTCFDITYNDSIKTEKFPVIIEDNPLMRVWFKQDDEFLVPKVNLTFDFVNPIGALDPVNYNLTYMYIQLFKDSMNEYAYNATLSGLSWGMSPNKYGITLTISGYHDKHRTLLQKIMDKMINFKVDEKRFNIVKECCIRSLKNFEAEQPYQHAVYYLAVLLSEVIWTKEELLAYTDFITVERLEQFVPQFLSKLHIECLIHGNLTEAEALETAKLVERELTKDPTNENNSKVIIPLLPQQMMLQREICLENGSYFLHKVENKLHKSSCTQLYYQSGLQSTESNMHLELLTHIISEPCFNKLRTKEQLGYIVYSGIRRNNGAQGVRVIVQSDRHPRYVEERIEAFIESMLDHLNDLPEKEFNLYKTSLATQRLEKPKTMGILSALFWSEIINKQYNFDRANIEVAYLMTITKEQIIKFFKEIIYQNSPIRRKLAVYVVSTASGGAGVNENAESIVEESAESNITKSPTNITNIGEFKASQSMFPLLKPFNNIPRKDQQSKL